jgi:hypothetical protein
MAIGNPRLHIICGLCGSNNQLKYYTTTEPDDETGYDRTRVTIACDNCSSLTDLDDVMEEEIEVTILLDIDGVMVHAIPHKQPEMEVDGFYKFNPEAVECLKYIIKQYDKAKVVLTSSHRFKYKAREWYKIFYDRGVDLNITPTIMPEYGFKDDSDKRLGEVTRYLDENYEPKMCNTLVILDDDKCLHKIDERYKYGLYVTDPYLGLSTDRYNKHFFPENYN